MLATVRSFPAPIPHASDVDMIAGDVMRVEHVLDAARDIHLEPRKRGLAQAELVDSVLGAAALMLRQVRDQLDALHTRMVDDAS